MGVGNNMVRVDAIEKVTGGANIRRIWNQKDFLWLRS